MNWFYEMKIEKRLIAAFVLVGVNLKPPRKDDDPDKAFEYS